MSHCKHRMLVSDVDLFNWFQLRNFNPFFMIKKTTNTKHSPALSEFLVNQCICLLDVTLMVPTVYVKGTHSWCLKSWIIQQEKTVKCRLLYWPKCTIYWEFMSRKVRSIKTAPSIANNAVRKQQQANLIPWPIQLVLHLKSKPTSLVVGDDSPQIV